MRDKKDSQHDLMTTIGIFLDLAHHYLLSKSFVQEYFTATPSEDMEMLLAISKRASATEASAKVATEALRRVFLCAPADFSRLDCSI